MYRLNPFWLLGRLYRAYEDFADWASDSFTRGQHKRKVW